jgi:hypothetical protein
VANPPNNHGRAETLLMCKSLARIGTLAAMQAARPRARPAARDAAPSRLGHIAPSSAAPMEPPVLVSPDWLHLSALAPCRTSLAMPPTEPPLRPCGALCPTALHPQRQ